MITANRHTPKITYFFKAGRRERLAELGAGPTEFFYGYQELLARGVDVSILEDSDVGMAPSQPFVSRLVNKLSLFLGGLPVGMALSLLTKRGCRNLLQLAGDPRVREKLRQLARRFVVMDGPTYGERLLALIDSMTARPAVHSAFASGASPSTQPDHN